MRIAFFHELPPGGAKRAVEEFGKHLKKDNDVDLYYVNEARDDTNNFSQVFFYKFTPKKWKGNNWKVRLYKDTLELFQIENLHKKIAKKINSNNYDAVIINASKFTQSPFVLKYLDGFCVYYCHDPHLRIAYEKILKVKSDLKTSRRLYEGLNRFHRKNIDKINISKAKLLIVNSRFTKEGVFRAYKRDSVVSYLGVDENFFKSKRVKKDIDLLFIGSTEELDGYYDLMNTQKHLPHLKIKVLDFKKEWVSDDTIIRNYYNRAKIVICLAFNEPFGLVPLEAMSCGVPVIAVDEGGYKETIKNNKTGFLVKRDPKIIAEKIQYLLNNKELASIMGREGRKLIETKWTWKKSSDNLLNVLRDNL